LFLITETDTTGITTGNPKQLGSVLGVSNWGRPAMTVVMTANEPGLNWGCCGLESTGIDRAWWQ